VLADPVAGVAFNPKKIAKHFKMLAMPAFSEVLVAASVYQLVPDNLMYPVIRPQLYHVSVQLNLVILVVVIPQYNALPFSGIL
jgi:hypothetical protein